MEVILERKRRLRVSRYCRAISLSLLLHRSRLPALRLIHVPVPESHRRRSGAAYIHRYAYTYRVWGRLLYNPKADPDQWRRYLRSTFGPAASHAETALSNASRVLPLLTTAHQPSASNLQYWLAADLFRCETEAFRG